MPELLPNTSVVYFWVRRSARFYITLTLMCLSAICDLAAAENDLEKLRKQSLSNAVFGRTTPYFDWTGLYVGGQVGYVRGKAQATLTNFNGRQDSFGSSFGSLTGGFQAGYNYVFPTRVLLGVEADASFMSYLSADDVAWSRATAVADTAEKVDYMATLRGRLGYAFPHWMIYGTGGYA